MNQFNSSGCSDHVVTATAGAELGGQQREHGTKTFTTGVDQVACGLLYGRHLATRDFAQDLFNLVQSDDERSQQLLVRDLQSDCSAQLVDGAITH